MKWYKGSWSPCFSYRWIRLFSETDSLSFPCGYSWASWNADKDVSFLNLHFFPSTKRKNVSFHNPYWRLGLNSCLSLYSTALKVILYSLCNTWILCNTTKTSLGLFSAKILSCGCLNLDVGIVELRSEKSNILWALWTFCFCLM